METKLKEMRLPWQLIFIKVEISEYIYNFYPFWEYIPRQQNWLARRWANVGTTVLALGVCAGLSKWLCNQFGQSLQKYFLRRKNIFLAEKNIFLAEKNISCGKKYFLRKKYISCGEKLISCGKNIFLAEKNIFLAEKNISCGKKYFLRKNIFCTMLPKSFRSNVSQGPGAIFTNSLDLRLDSRLGLDPDRVSSETRSGSKSSPIHKGKSSRLDWVATKVMT